MKDSDMQPSFLRSMVLAALLIPALSVAPLRAESLPSWREGPAREEIIHFVTGVTQEDGPDYVPPSARIAVFDNDGTLWSEQPFYAQLAFALDRIRILAADHPEFRTELPWKFAVEGDLPGLFATGKPGIAQIIAASHAGMSSDSFDAIVRDWIGSARHPKTGRPYTEMTYQPMRELISYLKDNEFQVYIVSGGGAAFIRAWSNATYGIPPQQVIGTTLKLELRGEGDAARLIRTAALEFYDDGPGKVLGIERQIGRRPIAAFGNSDGDIEMLDWVASGPGPRLAALLHHDDSEREYAYDRDSAFGHLSKGLDRAEAGRWLVISMARDWARIHPGP